MIIFWIRGTFSGLHLHPEVAPRDHDAVGRLEDCVEIIHRLRLLDLGDNHHFSLLLKNEVLEFEKVGDAADEGESDPVDPLAKTEGEVLAVLIGQGRSRNGRPRQVDPLAVLEHATDHDPAADILSGNFQHLQLHQPVVEKDPVAAANIAGEFPESRRDEPVGAPHLPGGNRHFIPRHQLQCSALHQAGADFRSLQVPQDRHRPLAPA
jgi:hypothetical protein